MSEIILSPKLHGALVDGADFDMSAAEIRRWMQLQKSASPKLRRKRTVPNVFATGTGRVQPRQGFLSTEIMRAVYIRSEVVRACVDTIIDIMCGIDWAVRPVDEEKSKWLRARRPELYQDQKRHIRWAEKFFKKPNRYQTLNQFHRVFVRDILVYDAGSYEVVFAQVGDQRLPVEIGVVAGDTVEVETDDAGMPIRYWQSYNTKEMVEFDIDHLAYVMLNPTSWHAYGLSSIETAYVSIAADLEANGYNASYFEKNGIPPALLAVMGVSAPEFRKLMASMRQTSSDNPWNIHAFRAPKSADGKETKVFDMVPLSQVSNRDMQFVELLTHTVRRITMMYRISPSQIGFTDEVTGGIGSGVAETQVDLMESKAIAPLLTAIKECHTEKILHNGCEWEDLEFAFVQSQTPKEQAERSNDMAELTSSVMTINEFREKWGGRDAVDWGDLPIAPPQGWQPPMTDEQRQQQMMMAQQGMQPPQQQMPPGQPPEAPEPPPNPMEKSLSRLRPKQQRRVVVRL